MPVSKADKKLEFFQWLDAPEPKCSRDEKCKELEIHRNTAVNWYREWKITKEVVEATSDDEQKRIVEQALYKEAASGKVNAAELLGRLRGWLVDKSEVKHLVVTLDDLNKVERAAGNRTADFRRELAGGNGSVPERPALLPGEVCQDRRFDVVQDSPVDAVALSDRTAGHD